MGDYSKNGTDVDAWDELNGWLVETGLTPNEIKQRVLAGGPGGDPVAEVTAKIDAGENAALDGFVGCSLRDHQVSIGERLYRAPPRKRES